MAGRDNQTKKRSCGRGRTKGSPVKARLAQARKLLTLSEMPIARIAQECGFSSQSHLTASFRGAHAVTPAQFRARIASHRE
ncbi:helix-turn-helix domain-containing protein [Microbulbifer magnicolonia]|uniref:helix-turn-helix domain-containing protein n=1 Tax=Microbulbifer magnicolonia TaxID=3109744 RepID=UPI002B401606|nr:helix-turn-helix domain-containing protein [Microbulbifer sp. GG15]